MKQIIQYSLLLIATACMVSCVSSKKFKNSQAEVERLNSEVTQLNAKSAAYEKQIAELNRQNVAYNKEAADCRAMREALAQKNEAFKQALAAEGTSMEQIEKRFETGLNKFADAGAEVTYKEGLLHITLNDQLLFAKGSTKIGEQGVEALGVVAEVMNDNPKIQLYVVGNTDTAHIKGKADNWSLSTERANTVVRILRDKYNVNPARLVAAGRGKYNPIADNGTEEGRAKNRRIDLIINANLNKLWDLYLQ
jgi:chemotaxis protein MotB